MQSEPEAYRRDVPNAEVYIVDGGHFALDTAADQIAQLVRGFVKWFPRPYAFPETPTATAVPRCAWGFRAESAGSFAYSAP